MNEWTVDPKKFMGVLSVLDLVPSRPGIPSSVFIQFEEVKGVMRMSLASDVAGRVQVEGKGSAGFKKALYLDRRLFFPFIFTAKTYKSDKPFVFSMTGKQVLVTQGRRRATFDPMAASAGYGELRTGKNGTVLPIDDKLCEAIYVANSCATSDPTVPELNCVYLRRNGKGIELYTSNQLIVFKAARKTSAKFPEKLPFPLFLIPFITHDGLKEVRIADKEVVLKFDCGYIWQGVSTKAAKGFPISTMNKLLTDGGQWPEVFKLDSHHLGAVTRRFSEYLTAIRRQDWLLSIKGAVGDKQIMLEVSIPQGIFREKVGIAEPLKQEVNVGWPLDSLLTIFEYLAKDKKAGMSVRFAKKTPYLLTAGGTQVVVTRKKS